MQFTPQYTLMSMEFEERDKYLQGKSIASWLD